MAGISIARRPIMRGQHQRASEPHPVQFSAHADRQGLPKGIDR